MADKAVMALCNLCQMASSSRGLHAPAAAQRVMGNRFPVSSRSVLSRAQQPANHHAAAGIAPPAHQET